MNSYNFHESYQADWQRFISQFPQSDTLDPDSLNYALQEWCYSLHKLIEHLYQQDTGYGSQMEIRFHWRRLESILEEHDTDDSQKVLDWFVTQLLNMINCNDTSIVESIWYSIGVDYFECGTDGRWLFPKLYQSISEKDLPHLIISSYSIPWKYKVATYKAMVAHSAQHEMLADALYYSCKAYCHTSCKSSEAVEILNQLDIPQQRHEQVLEKLTNPAPVKVVHAIAQTTKANDNVTGFVSIVGDIPTWFPYASLWIEDQCIGQFEEEYTQVRWRGYDSINTKYKLSTPEQQGHQEHILCVKVPFNVDWEDQDAVLKPL